MSDEQPEPDPVIIEVTADTGDFVPTMRRAESDLVFSFHPDLSTPAEREARYRTMRALAAAEGFREQMDLLHAQLGASREDVRRLADDVLRMGETKGGEPPTS